MNRSATEPSSPRRSSRPHRAGPAALAAVLAASLALLAAPRAEANLFRTFGFGPRPIAMGGAFTAVADDFTACYYNPAGVLARKQTRAGGGWQFIKQNYEVNGDPIHGNFTDGVYMGLAMPLPFKDWLADRIGIGYGFYMPMFYVVDLTVPEAKTPQWVLTESAPEVQIIHLSLAVDVVPGILLGGGATFLTDLGGSLDMHTGVRGIELSKEDQILVFHRIGHRRTVHHHPFQAQVFQQHRKIPAKVRIRPVCQDNRIIRPQLTSRLCIAPLRPAITGQAERPNHQCDHPYQKLGTLAPFSPH